MMYSLEERELIDKKAKALSLDIVELLNFHKEFKLKDVDRGDIVYSIHITALMKVAIALIEMLHKKGIIDENGLSDLKNNMLDFLEIKK